MSIYFKITNEKENNDGIELHNGLNESNDAIHMFYTKEHVHKYYDSGIYLRTVYLPRDDPDFSIFDGSESGIFYSNKIILGERYSLFDLSTFQIFDIPRVTIIWAIENNNMDFIKELTTNCDKEEINEALYHCCKNGYFDLIKYFVKDCCIDVRNDILPVYYASGHGELDIVKYLVENGCCVFSGDCTITDDDDDKTYMYCPLSSAVWGGYIDVVQYLTNNGAERDISYALSIAVINNDLELMRFFLEYPNVQLDFDESIENCISNERIEALRLLFPYEPNLDIYEKHFSLIYDNKTQDVAQFLLDNGVNIHVNDHKCFIKCAKEGNLEMVKFLLANGADVNARNARALIKAIGNNHLDVTKYLVDVGADISILKNYPIETLISTIVVHQNIEMFGFLYSLNAYPHYVYFFSLIAAASFGIRLIVEILLEDGYI